MLNLLKYNWLYSRLAFSITFTLQLLFHFMLLIGLIFFQWSEEIVTLMAILNMTIVPFVYSYYVLKVFNNSLKSNYRRILPVTATQEIFAIWLQLILYFIAHFLQSFVFFLLLYKFHQSDELTQLFNLMPDTPLLFTGIFEELWTGVVFVSLIMVSMTITYTFKLKYRVWIGVICFIIIIIANSTLHWLLIQNTDVNYDRISIQVIDVWMEQTGMIVAPVYQVNATYYFIDGIFLIASLLIMKYVMSKKIEI